MWPSTHRVANSRELAAVETSRQAIVALASGKEAAVSRAVGAESREKKLVSYECMRPHTQQLLLPPFFFTSFFPRVWVVAEAREKKLVKKKKGDHTISRP